MSPTAHVQGYWRRHSAALFRVLHIYLSMLSFAVLFFFASTGLLLNNDDWFSDLEPRETVTKGELDTEWLGSPDSDAVDKLQVVEHLRKNDGVKGEMTDFTITDDECLVAFRRPGYEADATIDRQTGDYDVAVVEHGVAAIVTDLHKGEHAGPVWHWVINAAALLILLVSLTGFALIFYLKRRRRLGLTMAVLAILAIGLIFFAFVR